MSSHKTTAGLEWSKVMKAIVWTAYGPPDVLQLKEIAKPVPRDDEVLIRVHATTVMAGDCELRRMKIPIAMRLPLRLYLGLTKPKRVTILGQELAGHIEAVGNNVAKFKPGDQVFAPTFLRLGAYAEYTCLPQTYPVLKPAAITYEEAATIPTGGIHGLHFLRVADVQSGQRVLINGAGGCIGTYAIQIARSWGAEVTAVDSTEKLAMLRSIGADHVVDYTQEDFTTRGEVYDVIIDVVGKRSPSGMIRALKPGGRLILGNAGPSGMVGKRRPRMASGKRVIIAEASYRSEHYTFLKDLIEAGAIKPIIDRCYPLEQTAVAHRYVDQGHKQGHVVITVH